jgi:hypothetical protein
MSDELRGEYHFDYRQARPNRFAALMSQAPRTGSSEMPTPEPVEDDAASSPVRLGPADIVDEVRAVLAAARYGKGNRPNYLTAFQILNRLPPATRDRLIRERGEGGAGTGEYAAPSVVSRAARMAGAEVEYLDSVGLSMQVAGHAVAPTYEVCGVYRLPAAAPADI